MWVLLIGMMFITGVFCLVIALYQLTVAGASPTLTVQIPQEKEDEEQGPKLTKLGRPIEEHRLSA